MNPFLKAGLVIGKCIVFAGVSFITYRFASRAAWEAGSEVIGLWTTVMLASGEQPLEAVLEVAVGAGA